MRPFRHGKRRNRHLRQEGGGKVGCLISLLLLGAGTFVALKAGPPYIAYKTFESDVKTEVSRAGAHFYDDDRTVSEILDIARRNEVFIKRENIKIERFGNQMQVGVQYSVPLDFVVYQHTMDFSLTVSSFVGRL